MIQIYKQLKALLFPQYRLLLFAASPFNPLTAGTAYIRVLIFY